MQHFGDRSFWQMAYYSAGLFVVAAVATMATIMSGIDPTYLAR